MRRRTTEAERMLWRALRRRAIGGMKWRRQHKIGRYIVDFYCIEKKLVIEVDGTAHLMHARQDMVRDDFLQKCGYKALRFHNTAILTDIEKVLGQIRQA